jgi:serine/threonine-protein kinase
MADRDVAGARLTKLGRYEVLSELGKGAMGVVYLARDPVIGRMVAIKTIKASSMGDDDSESHEFRERFVREAQTAGILSHPNIVTIHDIGEDPETQISFIAMEYIEGKTLKGLLLEKTPFTWDQIANMVAQVAEAMDYAHRKGIIHRDIKPANIIVTADEKVKITDFGIAKIASSNLTSTGQFLGTPNYMSPEQVSGSPVDGRSDIFSLGVVLYELLTRRKPFTGDNLTAISYKIVHEDFTPPAELSSDVPAEFNAIVARAMAKDPWNRYQRGKDLALALEQLRARFEEQKNLAELGTVVSSVSNPDSIATEKMADLAAIAAEGAREAAEASASRGSRPAPAAIPAVPAAAEASASRAPAPEPIAALAPEPAPGSQPTAKLPPAPGETTLSKRLQEPVRPAWFWAAAAAAVVLLLVAGILFVRRAAVSRPTVPFDGAAAKEVGKRLQDLEEGKRLYASGKYQESLALFRQVLAKDPNSKPASQYAQMAEAALQGRQEAALKSAEAQKALQLAQAAFDAGDYKEAKTRADEALALEPGSADAQKVRDEASTKIAEAEKKKQERVAAARKPTAVPKGKSTSVARLQPTAAPSSASATPTLRLLFNSPISEGHVMVAVNDEILLRRPFKFTRKEGLFKTIKETGTVDASIPVQAGALNVKVWLSGPDIPASTYTSTATQMPAGGSRILRLDYTGGRLSAKIQ